MHLKMKTGLSGPAYNFQRGAEVPFDDDFPFSANEVRRFIDPAGADLADYVGAPEDLDAWLAQWAEPVPSLFGSTALPAIVAIAGYEIQLGGIVNEGFTRFRGELPGETDDVAAANAWNELQESDREAWLAEVVDDLTADPDNIDRVILETSIVARPQAAAAAAEPKTEDAGAAAAGASPAEAAAPAVDAKPAEVPAPEKAAKPAAPKKTAAKKG